ncbi:acyl-CoA Delta(11) desaturase [Megalopta genalis]|uniref:acyl-CoA Delta(11) desaturase n=1 Tax=Megalopta genalis TaxID=115081 RepID=UPI003FD20F03
MDTETNHEKVHRKDNENEDVPYEVEEVVERPGHGTDLNYKHSVMWPNAVFHVLIQIGWLISIHTAFVHAKWATIMWAIFWITFQIIGVGLGAHRYFTHKSYKATPLMRLILVLGQTATGQNSAFTWVKDHTLHHKYSDTDLDPHNSNRGFFFAHMGWMMMKKHPLLRKKEREMDWSEMKKDKLLMFQHKYFLPVYFVIGMALPIWVPMYFWDETFWNSFFVAYILPYVTLLHATWSINSFAHWEGSKPYDKRVQAAESRVANLLTLGDGFHNYHHAFPWDYRMTDTPYSISAKILELFAYLGLAYDLKIATPKTVDGHQKRHGDGSFVDVVNTFNAKTKDESRIK